MALAWRASVNDHEEDMMVKVRRDRWFRWCPMIGVVGVLLASMFLTATAYAQAGPTGQREATKPAEPKAWGEACATLHRDPDEVAEFQIRLDGGTIRAAKPTQAMTLELFPELKPAARHHLAYLSIEREKSSGDLPITDCTLDLSRGDFVVLEKPGQRVDWNVWRITVFVSPISAEDMGVMPSALKQKLDENPEKVMRARFAQYVLRHRDNLKIVNGNDNFVPLTIEEDSRFVEALKGNLVLQPAQQDLYGAEIAILRKLQPEIKQLASKLRATANSQLDGVLKELWSTDGGCAEEHKYPPVLIFGTFELPTLPAEQTLALRVGRPAPSLALDRSRGSVIAWVTSVPSKINSVNVEWERGQKTGASLPDVLGVFASAVMPGGLSTKGKENKTQGNNAQNVDLLDALSAETGAGPEISLKELLLQSSECKLDHATILSIAHEHDILASYHSIVSPLAIDQLDRGYVYTVSVCNRTCGNDPADSTGKTSTQLVQGIVTTSPTWGFTLFGGLGYTFNLTGDRARSFSSPQWVQKASSASADKKSFKLESVRQPLQNLTASLYLSWRGPIGRHGMLGFGLGPDIVFGDGSGKLSQWTVAAFFAPCRTLAENGLYFTGGFGFRLGSTPLGAKLGDTVTAASAPSLNTASRTDWVMTLGIGLDLSIVTSSLFGDKLTPPTNQDKPKGKD
jgi:hypothetical protein